jgi:hypothetical protein
MNREIKSNQLESVSVQASYQGCIVRKTLRMPIMPIKVPNDLGRSPNPLASTCLHKVSSATQWDTTQKNQHKFLTSEQNHFPISCSGNNDNQILQLNLLSNFSFKTFQCEHSSRNLLLPNFFMIQRSHKKI